jgi:type IV fimbrial biogenesis protein FimT
MRDHRNCKLNRTTPYPNAGPNTGQNIELCPQDDRLSGNVYRSNANEVPGRNRRAIQGPMRTSTQGFTLIELIITVVIVSILAAVVVPGFTNIVRANRQVTNTNDLVAALHFTRSEAIRRGDRVTLCQSDDAASCTNANKWEEGWIVFNDANDNDIFDADTETLIRVHEGVGDTQTTVRADSAAIRNNVSFLATGFPERTDGTAQAGVFRICDDDGLDSARGVIVTAAGRVRSTRDQPDIVACP